MVPEWNVLYSSRTPRDTWMVLSIDFLLLPFSSSPPLPYMLQPGTPGTHTQYPGNSRKICQYFKNESLSSHQS
jgi:hypothetical protein